MQIVAPFTKRQVRHLNEWQQRDDVHPFTCPCGATLVAETDGWRCSEAGCDYRQNWAHDFMAKPSRERKKTAQEEAQERELFSLIFKKIAEGRELMEHCRKLLLEEEEEEEVAAEDEGTTDSGAQNPDI